MERGEDRIAEGLGTRGEAIPIVPEAMAGQLRFQEPPDAFNQVELRRIRWEPEHGDSRLVRREPGAKAGSLVVAGIVEDQHQSPGRPAGDDLIEERFERRGVDRRPLLGRQDARGIVQCPKHTQSLVGSGGGNAGGTSPSLPAAIQLGMGMNLALVEIHEVDSIGGMPPLFCSVARTWAALATASMS